MCIEVRLAGSGLSYKGRLEVRYSGYWGTVCSDYFGYQDAQVACYMLGFGYVRLNVNFHSPERMNINY